MCFLAVAWALLFLGAATWAVVQFAHARIPPTYVLRAVQTVAALSSTVRGAREDLGWDLSAGLLGSPADLVHTRRRDPPVDAGLQRQLGDAA